VRSRRIIGLLGRQRRPERGRPAPTECERTVVRSARRRVAPERACRGELPGLHAIEHDSEQNALGGVETAQQLVRGVLVLESSLQVPDARENPQRGRRVPVLQLVHDCRSRSGRDGARDLGGPLDAAVETARRREMLRRFGIVLVGERRSRTVEFAPCPVAPGPGSTFEFGGVAALVLGGTRQTVENRRRLPCRDQVGALAPTLRRVLSLASVCLAQPLESLLQGSDDRRIGTALGEEGEVRRGEIGGAGREGAVRCGL
jgi:hypothetical protein